MNEIQRWKPTTGEVNKIKMEVNVNGKYVTHADYLELERQFKALKIMFLVNMLRLTELTKDEIIKQMEERLC